MKDPRPVDSPTPDLERLAALLDGRLSDAERAEIVARAAASDDATGILADAAAVLHELEAQDSPAGEPTVRHVAPGTPRRHTGSWLALAAAVVLAVALPFVWRARDRAASDDAGRVMATLQAGDVRLPADWAPPAWRVTRGADADLSADARAIRAGALLTDLELAARSADPRASQLATNIARLIDPLAGSPPAVQLYTALARDGRPATRDDERLAQGRSAVEALLDRRAVGLGEWLEGARLAAAAGDGAFFARRPTPPSLEMYATSLPDSVLAPLRAARDAATHPPAGAELGRLGAAAAAALARLGS